GATTVDSMRILAVEDERDLADALRDDGYAVDLAHDSDDARVKATVFPNDLVALDLDPPGLDRRELCRGIRATDRHDRQPQQAAPLPALQPSCSTRSSARGSRPPAARTDARFCTTLLSRHRSGFSARLCLSPAAGGPATHGSRLAICAGC